MNPTRFSDLVVKALPSIVTVLALAISFLYFSVSLSVMQWPPAGDITYHGFYTSIIIYDQRIPTNFSPFINLRLNYPLGFHVNAAFLSLLLGIYPGESVFLFGAILMIALTSLVFTLTYIITKSTVLSITTYVLLFLTYSTSASGGDLEEWLFGYFFNGPYPNIFGFLVIVLSATAVAILARTKDQRILTRFFPILIIVELLVYPSFFFVPLALFVFAVLQFGVTNSFKAFFKTRKDAAASILLLILFIYFAPFTYSILTTQTAFSGAAGQVSQEYTVPIDYIFGSVFGFSIIFAFLASSTLIVISFNKETSLSNSSWLNHIRELRPLFATYVLFTLVLFLSLNAGFFEVLQYLLPRRLMIAVMILSIVLNVYVLNGLFSVFLNRIFGFVVVEKQFAPDSISNLRKCNAQVRIRKSRVKRKTGVSGTTRRVHSATLKNNLLVAKSIAVAFVLLFLFNSNGLLAYSLSSHPGPVAPASYFQNDFNGMEWLYRNARDGQLILNDWSFDGTYLPSLSAMNVTMHLMFVGLNRTKDLERVWFYPQNQTLVNTLIVKYNVTYIFSTSEWGYFNWTDWKYEAKPYTPQQYIEIFSNDSLLELVFRAGNTSIFLTK
jgi:hypothetical protein